MTIYAVLLVAVALGTDAFSMAVGLGLSGIRRKQLYLFAGTVTLFHIIMPLAGLWLGSLLGKAVGQWAAYLGAVVLIFIGVQMLREGWGETPQTLSLGAAKKSFLTKRKSTDLQVITGIGALLLLAGSVSLDALTVGFSLGTLKANLLVTVLIMGLIAGVMTTGGLVFGKRLGRWLGEKAQVAGGIILIVIGIRMFF